MPRASSEETSANKALFLEKYKECGTLAATAAVVGISKWCAGSWVREDPDFAVEYFKLKQSRIEEIEDFLTQAASGHIEKVQMPQVTAAIFMLKSLDPKRFGEKKIEEITKRVTITHVEVIKPLQLTQGEIIDGESTSIS